MSNLNHSQLQQKYKEQIQALVSCSYLSKEQS